MGYVRCAVIALMVCFFPGCGDKVQTAKTGPKLVVPAVPVVTPAGTLKPVVTTSTVQANPDLGPGGLWTATPPGWHSVPAPAYPQWIATDFGTSRSFSRVGILPQNGQPARGPKAVDIEASDDGKTWHRIGGVTDACQGSAPDGWFDIDLLAPTNSRYLRVLIMSNCGSPDLLTVQGLRTS